MAKAEFAVGDEKQLLPTIKVRPMEDGSFDELIADEVWIHAEMMDDDCLWIGIYQDELGHKDRVVMWIRVEDGKLRVTAEVD